MTITPNVLDLNFVKLVMKCYKCNHIFNILYAKQFQNNSISLIITAYL